ncbi:uncharacterized protein LOC123295875 [Chrysoperla carnea]|uniref:uncharacterized protein LOC123295875 n=1 Tax=Chrysoperla carnea TaxID=189513 RepID=UPI001D05EE17|nr:uncharacterized protein LOC123295875 [Chrysoperla carnea]
MNNAVFGKTMENIRKRRVVKLRTRWFGRYGVKVLIAKPNFYNRTIFSENLVAIEMKNLSLYFNRPIIVGMATLDIAKTCFNDFHYGYVKPKFGDKAKGLYTDTDSIIYSIETDDIYEIKKADIDRFDTSDYEPNNIYGMPLVNKKVSGLMKDELNGKIMTEFIGLRAKMYTYKIDNDNENIVKKIKGIKRDVVKNQITFEDYYECLNKSKIKVTSQKCIRSFKHKLYSIKESKIALSGNDDKRCMIDNSFDTYAWGHYKLRN